MARTDSAPGPSKALTAYVFGVAVAAVVLSILLFRRYPPAAWTLERCIGLLAAGVVLHVLNQLNFTIRFRGQRDNVEITFTEAALVALFYPFGAALVALLSGLVHYVREVQARRRRKLQVIFNTAEIMLSLALAGFVYHSVRGRYGMTSEVVAFLSAMLTHSVANRLLVGTVISLNAGGIRTAYYKSLFVDNVVMLFMNIALGMTAVMAFIINPTYLLWVPFAILGVLYLGYQAYVGQLRDSNTMARLYENAGLSSVHHEADLVPMALSNLLDTFTAREVSFTMAGGPETLAEWRLAVDQRTPAATQRPGSVRALPGSVDPLLLESDDGYHARPWRQGAKFTAMAAPVQYEGQLLGVLRAEKPRAWDAFTSGDLRAFSLFARQLGGALENARLQELDHEQQRLRQKALDAERNRISRDLHDSFVQTLVQVDLHLAYLTRLLEKRPDDVPREIATVQENVREGLLEARSYMAELKPLRIEPGEFLTVAQRYLDDFAAQYHLETHLESDGHPLDLTGDDLTELFQIVREALNNVAKHAKASSVVVRFTSDDIHLAAEVQDNGVGFDITRMPALRREGHFGLANICERATGLGGVVDWDSAPGEGTTLIVTVPRRTPSDILKGVAS